MYSIVLVFDDKNKLKYAYNPCIVACATNLYKKEIKITFLSKIKFTAFLRKNYIDFDF